MLTREMQLALMERIRGYRGDPKTGQDAAAAYREFFPDAVQAHEFHDCWQAVVEEERAAARRARETPTDPAPASEVSAETVPVRDLTENPTPSRKTTRKSASGN